MGKSYFECVVEGKRLRVDLDFDDEEPRKIQSPFGNARHAALSDTIVKLSVALTELYDDSEEADGPNGMHRTFDVRSWFAVNKLRNEMMDRLEACDNAG